MEDAEQIGSRHAHPEYESPTGYLQREDVFYLE